MIIGNATAAGFRRRVWLGMVAALAAVLLLPLLLDRPLSFCFYLMLWVTMASAVNIMAGLTGYIPFGYVAFYGVGAYVTAVLVAKFGYPVPVALFASAAAGMACSVLFAPTLRLRGIYFSMVSLALAMICRLLVSEIPEDLSGGSFGLVLGPSNSPRAAYAVMLGVMVAALAAAGRISSSRLGVALRAIRDNPMAAQVMGVDVAGVRLKAWVVAGLFPALTGGVEAWYTNLVDPDAAFNTLISAKSLIFAIAGGLGTLTGPVVGSVVMVWVDDLVWQRFPLFNLFFLGAAIVGLMLFLPHGIVGSLIARRPRLRRFIP
ncbi:MAG: branched-chain amino acid ABC transporter permease [Rhodospirillaceae bacterium]